MTSVTWMRAAMRVVMPAVGVLAVACAGNQIGSPTDYNPQPLDRVFPYPSPDELARQKTEVYLASHYTSELAADVVGPSMTLVQQDLLRVLDEAGARVIDRSLDDLKTVRKDLTKQYKERGEKYVVDSALVSRISRFDHTATYEPASGLFKSEEELAGEPGTCTHVASIEVDVNHLVIPTEDVPRTTFTVRNQIEMEEKQMDESCPIEEDRKQQLLDEAFREALPCLATPVKNEFAPRGYIEEHRMSLSGDFHIYKTSFGRSNGAKPGLRLTIFRTQYVTSPEGDRTRRDKAIGYAVVSDQIGKDFSWILIGDVEEEVLAGHMVRAVYEDSFQAADLGFGGCSSMYEETRAPR